MYERDIAGADFVWNKYEDDETMARWYAELQIATDPNSEKWYINHPDGRQNIAYKTGAWIVDRAIDHSGISIIELTRMNYKDIISLANV